MNSPFSQAVEPVGKLLLTVHEAAEALAISERTLWTLSKNGEIIPVRIGRAVRYDVVDLRSWIENRKSRSSAKEGG